jgi:release factor glutamine methyltransferase
MLVKDLLVSGREAGLSPLDSELLVLHALQQPTTRRAWLRAHDTDTVTVATQLRFDATCAQRAAGIPIAYLTGQKGFYGLDLHIDARVLDPRPDTETLVDWALDLLKTMAPTPRVADLGTGSGAIALALQHHCAQATVLGLDASADALAVAQGNARRLNLPVQFTQGHWCAPLGPGWDLLVSNPPYIADNDPHLPALRHEPRQALTSGVDGLDDLRHIVAHAPGCLAPGGWLLLEHGFDQGQAVHQLLLAQGFSLVQSRQDLGGHVRCTGGQWLPQTNAG